MFSVYEDSKNRGLIALQGGAELRAIDSTWSLLSLG